MGRDRYLRQPCAGCQQSKGDLSIEIESIGKQINVQLSESVHPVRPKSRVPLRQVGSDDCVLKAGQRAVPIRRSAGIPPRLAEPGLSMRDP